MYEFVFAMGEVNQPFKVFDSFPRMEIFPSCEKTLDDTAIPSGCLIPVEFVDGPPPLDLLEVHISFMRVCYSYTVGMSGLP